MKIVNLTPHALTLHGEGGTLTIAPSGAVARLTVIREALSPVVIDGVNLPVSLPTMGEIVGLPAPAEGVVYVASAIVADAAKRGDVFSPGELLRDQVGAVIGARGLCAYGKEGA